MERPLYAARLTRKLSLSERTECFHLEFTIDALDKFEFMPGQFVSAVGYDPAGKQQTRAYSMASAPRGNQFDLCLNRVENGFFSNVLCDLKAGQTVEFHGPHGLFTLREPLTDSIFIATGTGIAPILSFVQQLFPSAGPDRSGGHEFWLVYGTRCETELYYREYFEKVAAEHANFHYMRTLSRPHDGWEGTRGYVQDLVEAIATGHTKNVARESNPPQPAEGFSVHAYICGLNEMVAANRERLKALGWHRRQIIFERYD